jgi:predicted deacylase
LLQEPDAAGEYIPRQSCTYVEAGMKLGYVTDFFGKTISEPRAPNAGVILHLDAAPSLKKGDNIADIGVVSPKAP